MSSEPEESESADWEVVKTVGTDEEATLVVGFLASNGIEAQVESLLFHQEPVTFGRLGEVRVRVPAERAAEARERIAELPGETPMDGESIDGEPGEAQAGEDSESE